MMSDPCTYIHCIAAYHDGEQSNQDRAVVEAHLADGCAECTAELKALRRLSARMQTIPAPDAIAPATVAKLHHHVDSLNERSVLHFAELLSGIAAAVLIVSSIWAMRASDVSAEPIVGWERAAVTLQPDVAPVQQQPVSMHAAEWIVNDLSSGAGSR